MYSVRVQQTTLFYELTSYFPVGIAFLYSGWA